MTEHNKQNTEIVLWSAMTASGLEISALNSGAMRFDKGGNVRIIPADDLYSLIQNKQPPAEAGEGAVAEVRYTSHPYKDCVIEWVGQDKPEIGTKLYTSQTTATQAAVAEAMLNVREGLRIAGIRMGLAGEELEFFISDTLSAFIPADAMQALEEFCFKVLALYNDDSHIRRERLRAIVTSVIERG